MNNTAQSAIRKAALSSQHRPSCNFGQLVVGVLQHEQRLDGENFLWFIAKPTHPIEKIRSAYIKQTQVKTNVTLKIGGGIFSESTPLSQLSAIAGDPIVLTAHLAHTNSPSPISGHGTLIPLQPVDPQIHNIPATKVESKVEPPDERPDLQATTANSGHNGQVEKEPVIDLKETIGLSKPEIGKEDTSLADDVTAAATERISLTASIQQAIDEGTPEAL